MTHKIWLMEGLSSQRDMILAIKSFAETRRADVTIFASHRNERNEILSLADRAILEPKDEAARLSFILTILKTQGIHVIHAGRHGRWCENHRREIESLGVKLTTGTVDAKSLLIADDKVSFADEMEKLGLAVVPSIRVSSVDELRQQIAAAPFSGAPLCVKPVTGIYGMGFWRFDDNASPMSIFTDPDRRLVAPKYYLQAQEEAGNFAPLVLMPYLPGPEYSVDMLVENGTVLAAVARRKVGALQYLENSGEAYQLAIACAEAMQADGLVNVQTRNNSDGIPQLLEINMRPSGGIGYTRFSGVNLPGLFALRQLGLLSTQQVVELAVDAFSPATVRAITDVVRYQTTLSNRLQEG
ncbi:ATP-grasp domain-containing protein [Pectobacterium versatile]|uniref:ATP-grasp domain-containing protein n=1 Tax=Pectobacterium versatile TaxID=2488639 RepID=A0A855MKE3_9GAMM|nr:MULTISPECIES: ATP-grasp domain-containing protein [Pectobacterium]MBA0185365.1 ATP-grasp domain-containing protein [Pectobacterium versatile]MBQ4777448.1 carbamoyl-phosphate synthase large chain [Pectobacterium versatile]MCL6387098.1 carbamoyl-phosphate synthase large chain [Pectobacterium carotovorum subsp. carotovorum]POY50944.1 carbamoyl-phosphate synthase large chain [Pectobacterium versatile]PVY73484.1 ATP-grasp domain-containing protein [Pectobacterium versatile]